MSPFGTDLAAQTDWDGDLHIYSVYQPANDFPDQYTALKTIYAALGGEYWNAAFKQTSYAKEIEAMVNAAADDSKLCASVCLLLYTACLI